MIAHLASCERVGVGLALGLLGLVLSPKTAPCQGIPDKPKVLIVATGGTIANSTSGRLPVDAVLHEAPEIAQVADIEVHDFARIPSSAVTLQNWLDLARLIPQKLAADSEIQGVVVTHGSNTAEETAYFLHLVLDTSRPVVVVGAQRQRGFLSEDGSRNLYDAVRVAAHPAASGRGVLVVVNELIHSARDVTKTISYRQETWSSGDLGALGLVDLDRVRFYRSPDTRHTVDSALRLRGVSKASDLPRVDIVYAYADAGPELVEAAAAAGAKGIVVAGFPTGLPTPAMTRALERAEANGVFVVMSHRGGRGRIQTSRPFTSADNLTPQKARILLMLALASGAAPGELESIFLAY